MLLRVCPCTGNEKGVKRTDVHSIHFALDGHDGVVTVIDVDRLAYGRIFHFDKFNVFLVFLYSTSDPCFFGQKVWRSVQSAIYCHPE